MSTHSTRLAYLGGQRRPVSVWATLQARLAAMILARRTRHLLAAMDDHTLADIGIGHGDAMFEAARPFWDVDSV